MNKFLYVINLKKCIMRYHNVIVCFVSLLFLSIVPVTALEIEDTYLQHNDTYQIESYEKAEVEFKKTQINNESIKLKPESRRVFPRMESFIYTVVLVVSFIILCRLLCYTFPANPGNEWQEAVESGWCWILLGVFPMLGLTLSIEFDW